MAEHSDEIVRAIQLSMLAKGLLDGLRHCELAMISRIDVHRKTHHRWLILVVVQVGRRNGRVSLLNAERVAGVLDIPLGIELLHHG